MMEGLAKATPNSGLSSKLRFWDVAFMSWLFQVLLNYLFIILPVYCASLELGATDVGQMFAVNIGMRFFPNLLVTKMGATSEIPMVIATLLGFCVSYVWPEETWALYAVAAGCGCGFTRACVSLHAQRACNGNLDDLTLASKRCGAARSLGDISGFVLPPLAYKLAGWQGFTAFGAALSALYLLMAIAQLQTCSVLPSNGSRAMNLIKETREERKREAPPIAWIDWAVSAAFISTELQMNLFITAVPQALLRHFDVAPTFVGVLIGTGAFFTLLYIMALPYLPSAFNQQRPVNLILTYAAMAIGWLLMLGSLTQPYAPAFLCAAYFYQSMAGASQIVMLECLTGICDSTNSAKILGVAEMVGCVFGMAGGYAGEALLDFGITAPFVVGLACSIASATFLMLSFVLRQSQRDSFSGCSLECEKPSDVQERLMINMISGVNKMVLERSNSFISSEIQYRQPETELPQLKACEVV